MDWPPRSKNKAVTSKGGGGISSENFLLGATDGRFFLLNRNGKADKGVEAHQGAILCVKWNPDGSSFATDSPIYSLTWSSTALQLLFTLGKQLVLQSLQANVKPTAVWDAFGRLLFSSTPYNNPITSLAWSSDGQMFAVGSFNILSLCDKRGWSYATEKTKTGSLMDLSWSADSTQIAAAGGNGQVIVGLLIDRLMEWSGFEAAIVNERTIEVHNVRNGAKEHLEYRDRIPKATLGYDHLIVTTVSQCYIYKYFVLVDGSGLYVYTYEGRLVCSPKHPNLRTDVLHSEALTVCNDTLAVKNRSDEKMIYLFETQTGKPIGDGKPIVHTTEVLQIGLDQCGPPLERRLMFLDRNKDLYLASVRVFGTSRKSIKLGTMMSSAIWSETSNVLAAMSNDNLVVWFHPNIAFIDSDLLAMTTYEHENQEEFGKQAALLHFRGSRISVQRANGTVQSCVVSPYPDKLHQLILNQKWSEALSLCRNVKDKILWACLAGFATHAKDLDTAEVAFAEIEEVDKVEYIRYIKSLPTKEMRTAEMLLLSGEPQDAEGVLLQAGLHFYAIMTHLNMYNWNRAMELSTKYNMAMEIVASRRAAYLQEVNRPENLEKFQSLPKMTILNAKMLKEAIDKEYDNERGRALDKPSTKPTNVTTPRQAVAT